MAVCGHPPVSTPDDSFRRKRPGLDQNAGVLLGVDVVGDGGDVEFVAQALAELLHERGFSRADRAANSDAKGLFARAHDRNSLEYCVSCRMAAMSERNAQEPRSARRAV